MSESLQSFDAGLAKRLGEAADCFRDNLYHYFVCKLKFPYDLRYSAGHLSDQDASSEADTILQSLDNTYKKFGPYKTDADDKPEPDIEYDSIQLRFMQGNNELYCETLSNDTDAIILSLSAYDKFFQPYYTRLYGIDVAQEFRKNAIDALTAQQKKPSTHKGRKSSGSGTGGTRFVADGYER